MPVVTVLGMTFYVVIINKVILFRLIIILPFIKYEIINRTDWSVYSLTLMTTGERDVCVDHG